VNHANIGFDVDIAFVHRVNIAHYRKKLAEQVDEATRQTLRGLLSDEEDKLKKAVGLAVCGEAANINLLITPPTNSAETPQRFRVPGQCFLT